jgi:hypothetical protein
MDHLESISQGLNRRYLHRHPDAGARFGRPARFAGARGKHKVLVIRLREKFSELRGQNDRLKTPFAIPSSMRVFGNDLWHGYAQPFPIGEKL